MDKDKLAESLGLINTPQITFASESEVTLTNTMSRAEQRAARIKLLREQARARKAQKQQEQQKQIWDQVPDGESIGDSDDE